MASFELPANVWLDILSNASYDNKRENIISDCPFCGKEQHFGVGLKPNKKSHERNNAFHCFKCGERGFPWKLLDKLNRLELYTVDRYVDIDEDLVSTLVFAEPEVEIPGLEEVALPLGYRRNKTSDEYLDSRGWTARDYEYFNTGRSKVFSALKDYVILAVEEGGMTVGYLCRSIRSKEWIEEENARRRQEAFDVGRTRFSRYLRFKNAEVDFANLLYNLNHVTENTHTVIIVEGFGGVQNITKQLNLYNQDKIVVVATFGKKISDVQIAKLQKFGVKNIILIFDSDAIKETKEHSLALSHYFSVQIGFTAGKEDSGDICSKQLFTILDSLENPLTFTLNKLVRRVLI